MFLCTYLINVISELYFKILRIFFLIMFEFIFGFRIVISLVLLI